MPRDPSTLSASSPQKVLAAVLSEIRLERDETQETIAGRGGVIQGAVGHWETGRRSPALYDLVRVARAYGVTPADLAARIAAAMEGKPKGKRKG